MSYSLEISEQADKKFSKLRKGQMEIINNKVQQILDNPHHFKPLRGDLAGARRVHIDKSFVLIYEIMENERLVRILDYDHHDRIYK